MATVPTTRTWVAGEIVTAAYMNNTIRDVDNWLLAPAICKVRQTVAQSLTTSGTPAAITFDAEDVDSTGMHSTVTNISRITAVYPGWYWVGGGISYAINATGVRTTAWRINGAATPDGNTLRPGFATFSAQMPARASLYFLNVGDYLELFATQTSGGALSTAVANTGEQPNASVVWASN